MFDKAPGLFQVRNRGFPAIPHINPPSAVLTLLDSPQLPVGGQRETDPLNRSGSRKGSSTKNFNQGIGMLRFLLLAETKNNPTHNPQKPQQNRGT